MEAVSVQQVLMVIDLTGCRCMMAAAVRRAVKGCDRPTKGANGAFGALYEFHAVRNCGSFIAAVKLAGHDTSQFLP